MGRVAGGTFKDTRTLTGIWWLTLEGVNCCEGGEGQLAMDLALWALDVMGPRHIRRVLPPPGTAAAHPGVEIPVSPCKAAWGAVLLEEAPRAQAGESR